MENRLKQFLLSKRNNGEKILSIYLPAGYPEIGSTVFPKSRNIASIACTSRISGTLSISHG
jgi:hypothetical protein